MEKEKFLSTSELAKKLGISRIAVFQKIKKGEIEALKVGRNYIIPQKQLKDLLGETLTDSDKKLIDLAVKKIVKEYSQTLKLLGSA